jgi:hypothetical protein
MLDETTIKQMSRDIDEYLSSFTETHNIGPLSLSAIVLARLLKLHTELSTEQEFRSLVNTAMSFNALSEKAYENFGLH